MTDPVTLPLTHTCDRCGGPLEFLGEMARRVFGRCRDCGYVQATPDCPECFGLGEVIAEAFDPENDLFTTTDVCPVCQGSGRRP